MKSDSFFPDWCLIGSVPLGVVVISAAVLLTGADPKPGSTVKFHQLQAEAKLRTDGDANLQKQIDALAGRVKVLEAAAPAEDVGFLDYPAADPVRLANQNDVTIEKKSFVNLGANVTAIEAYRCKRLTIRDCHFADIAQGITCLECEELIVEGCWCRNIIGPHTRPADGGHRANFLQFDKCLWFEIRLNEIDGGEIGDTEDVLSIYKSGGTRERPAIIEDNTIAGSNWNSASGSGIMIGDGGGHPSLIPTGGGVWVVCRRNQLFAPGQVALGIAGGHHTILENNVIFCPRGWSPGKPNVGISVGWDQTRATCFANVVRGNRVFWVNATGVENAAWFDGDTDKPEGWAENDWSAEIDPAGMQVDW